MKLDLRAFGELARLADGKRLVRSALLCQVGLHLAVHHAQSARRRALPHELALRIAAR